MTNNMHTISVLIIDDSEDDRELYKRALKKVSTVDYTVHEASDGKAGIAFCATKKPDCILLDYSLPGLNGVAVLHEIRTLHNNLPVVMLTGQGSETVAVDVMKAGAQDYLIKDSISSLSLHRAIANAILYCAMENNLEQKRQSLEVFTRAMAHDLKEPVRAIKSFSELLQKELKTDVGAEFLGFIIKAATNMETLINNVSRYTKLEVCNDLQTEHVALEDVVDQVKTNLHSLIQERNASITTSTLPTIVGNAGMLTQLMQNLIANAIHYCTDKPPVITVTAATDGNKCQLSIKDNGPGIPEKFQDTIFLPFKRLVGSDIPGTGLGLAIAKKIAELHGAVIRCESQPGEGSTFFISIPPLTVSGQSTTPDHHAQKNVYESITRSRVPTDKLANILLVDDNPLDLKLTTIGLMERDGVQFNLHTAHDGAEALKWLKERIDQEDITSTVDLILLDINMPRMGGFELLKTLKAEGWNIPVSMLSTSNDLEDMRTAKDLGAAGFMVKPATIHQLQEILEYIPTLQLVNTGSQYQLQRAA